MTEAEWDACADPWSMPRHFKRKASLRKIRLFNCACCRRLWAHLPEAASRAAVETAERYADGLADDDELRSAYLAASQAAHNAALARGRPYKATCAEDAASDAAEEFNSFFPGKGYLTGPGATAAYAAGEAAYRIAGSPPAPWRDFRADHPAWHAAEAAEKAAHASLVRDLFGNPFRPAPAVDPRWLVWNGGTVARLAAAIYAERRFGDLPILADALEDAGCADAAMLAHCRGGGEHVRGCWFVDLLTGRQ